MSLKKSNPPQRASPLHPRTFRLALIPTTIDDDGFRQYLGGLECENGIPTQKILAFGLAPYMDWLVATVTFHNEPLIFMECRPNCQLSVSLPSDLCEATITVDCDFYGITPLYHPASKPKYDLVAVSELASHAFGSWKSPHQSYTMWLRDFVPIDFPDIRVLSWGYESGLESSVSTMAIADFARQLLITVGTARETSSSDNEMLTARPIIFVGHSLGGLVIKQALVDAAQGSYQLDKAILNSCIGIFLFGVPNRGLNNENLLSLMKGKKSAPFVSNLMQGSELLQVLHTAFLRSYENILKSCFVVSFYEMEDTKTIRNEGGEWKRTGRPVRMVSKESATWFMPREEVHNQVPMYSDHSQLVKFTNRADHNYLAVRAKMKELVEKAPEILRLRREDSMGVSVYFLVPFPQNSDYIGTSQALKDKLNGNNAGDHQRLALWGLAGVGKTQDVLNFVYEFKSPRLCISRSVFWVHAGSALRFEQDYRKLAELVKLPGWDDLKQDIRPIVKNWFECPKSGDWILILDNADDKLVFFPELSPDIMSSIDQSTECDGLAQYIPRGSKGIEIVTTRDYEVADLLASTNTLCKEVLGLKESKQLFEQHYPRVTGNEEHGQSITLLLKELQYLPLAIVQVAAFLRQNRILSPSHYLKRFNSTKDSQKRLLSKQLF
ncbi:P-loop containing nucleoside triphosphate hydrolase protein [Trichophaea hybrida]|nr:P-loop containing nucleoside triphosphate hydrolase protein [Trichophaea hybrida]